MKNTRKTQLKVKAADEIKCAYQRHLVSCVHQKICQRGIWRKFHHRDNNLLGKRWWCWCSCCFHYQIMNLRVWIVQHFSEASMLWCCYDSNSFGWKFPKKTPTNNLNFSLLLLFSPTLLCFASGAYYHVQGIIYIYIYIYIIVSSAK